jgi:hypothetical protein
MYVSSISEVLLVVVVVVARVGCQVSSALER